MRRGVSAVLPTPLLAVVLLAVLAVGCTREPERQPVTEDPRRPTITIASFDFPESELLAELYGQALQRHGYPVEQVTRLGTREVVDPALLQGKVDLVPEYLGSALSFLQDRRYPATADPTLTHARLRQLFGMRGVSVLAFAPAEDRNGFVVTGDLSRGRGVKRLSDLAPIAGQLSFGGPPECPERPLCLQGLRDVYGLQFERFLPMPTRAVTAAALGTGEIDVGMIDTTDGSLPGKDLVQLRDDRRLQPAENVVPAVRYKIVAAYGPALERLLNAASAQLTTADLAELNRVVAEGQQPAAVAASWLRSHTIID
jgi:osmoprotectant transport system substrate-binding protein